MRLEAGRKGRTFLRLKRRDNREHIFVPGAGEERERTFAPEAVNYREFIFSPE